jgi:hypothetical protein
MNAPPSAPTISFSSVGSVGGIAEQQSRYPNRFSFRLPFRMFGFRF